MSALITTATNDTTEGAISEVQVCYDGTMVLSS